MSGRVDRVSIERHTDGPTPGVGLQLSPSDGATIKDLEAGEGWSDFMAEVRFYQPEGLRQLADRLQAEADWMEREQGTGDSRRGYVKREFDCGHWILIPDDFGRHEICPFCPGEFVKEVTPDDEDFEEATWT